MLRLGLAGQRLNVMNLTHATTAQRHQTTDIHNSLRWPIHENKQMMLCTLKSSECVCCCCKCSFTPKSSAQSSALQQILHQTRGWERDVPYAHAHVYFTQGLTFTHTVCMHAPDMQSVEGWVSRPTTPRTRPSTLRLWEESHGQLDWSFVASDCSLDKTESSCPHF